MPTELLRSSTDHCVHNHSSADFASEKAIARYAPDMALEPIHIRCDLRVHVPQRTVHAKVITTVESKREGRSLVLDGEAFKNVHVELVDRKDDEEIEWRYDGCQIHVTFNKNVKQKETRKIQVSYTVESPVNGLYFSGTKKGDVEYVMTDHESERARYWLACVDHPNVRTTYEFYITADQKYSIVANGLLVKSEKHNDGTHTEHWKLDQVCPSYLCCFAVGEFVSVRDRKAVDNREMDFAYYTIKGTPEQDLKLSFGNTPEIMSWLVNKVGNPFPYPKYYQIAVPMKRGAMENISLTTWGQYFVVDAVDAQDWGWVTELVNVHEMSHSYFGDSLGMRYFEHAWLKESWATFMEFCWLEDKKGTDHFHFELYEAANAYFDECGNYVRPIVAKRYDSSWTLFDNHLYPGGGWRIRMLRRLMGDSTFWTAIKDYVATYSYKLVETDDFRKVLEKHSGMNLTQFFDQWFYGCGYPKLKGTFNWDSETKLAKITLEQTQMNEKQNIGLFNIQIDVVLLDDNGNRYSGTVVFEGARGSISLALPSKPVEIQIDPEVKVLFSLDMNPGDDLLFRALEKGHNILHRIWAAKELIKNGSATTLRRIGQTLQTEQFYGVKFEAASALSKLRSPVALEVLNAMLERETDPYARMKIASVCKVRSPILAATLQNLLKKGELSYRTKAHILEALGVQRDPSLFGLLSEHANDTSHLGFVRSGALKGIGNLRSKEAYNLLKQRIYTEREEARFGVVTAFAEVASWMDPITKKEAIEVLVEQLWDEHSLFKRFVVEALIKLEANSAASALQNAKQGFAKQDHYWVDKKVKQLREITSADTPAVTKLKQDYEELNGYVKKLEEKIQALQDKQ